MEFEAEIYPDDKLPCNRENMTKLVEALESGKYPQARGYLRLAKDLGDDDDDESGFCCAGVACDVSGTGTWELHDSGDFFNYKVPGHWERAFMPKPVIAWLGLEGIPFTTQELPLSGPNEIGDYLLGTAVNDEGWTFQQIAARLREVYLTD